MKHFLKIDGFLNEIEKVEDNVFEGSKIIELEKLKERERILEWFRKEFYGNDEMTTESYDKIINKIEEFASQEKVE